jgi:hypothetical protein
MEKRSTVLAVYAESLVFESNFGSTTTNLGDEVAKRAQSIPAKDATDLSSGNARTSGATPMSEQVWPIF